MSLSQSAARYLLRTRRISYGRYAYIRAYPSRIPQDACTCCFNTNLPRICRLFQTTQTILSKKKASQQNTEETVKTPDTLNENVPLIVKLLHKNLELEVQGKEIKPKQAMSVEQLQKSLEDIQWDRDATVRRDNIEEVVQEDSIQDENNAHSEGSVLDMNYVEDIFVDDDIQVQGRTQNKSKQKVKGTPDPSIPASDIPCSGCGATLHCQDPVIPGYMPSEKFKCLTKEDMRMSVCQRCFLIQVYNMYLNVKVSAKTYPKILREIRKTKALVVVVVDLFDMKNSVYKDLLKHIGTNRPLFVVGTKVDLIPRDTPGYLERMKTALLDVCESAGLNPTGMNIQHVSLVSAKTGYGIEELVTKLMTFWKLQGHVYVVGSTNAGKSTLFNALLMSDYCKTVARGFINRATVSVWPGTTLSLLKFPIISPAPWRLILRSERLHKDQEKFQAEEALRKSRLLERGSYKAAVLTGHIGITDFRSPQKIAEDEEEAERFTSGQDVISFSFKDNEIEEISGQHRLGKGLKGHGYKPDNFKMYWCNDTPGVINPHQIINLLEPEELMVVLPRHYVHPRVVLLNPGQVLFVTGMGRVDFVEGKRTIHITVFASHSVPLHVKKATEADDFYSQTVGTATLGVPLGDEDRLSKIPSLVGKEFHITGTDWQEAAADIQLSSLGWVSVAAAKGMEVKLRAYTPGGRGLHLQTPALLPKYTQFRGKRRGKTPFFRPRKIMV